jgi:hypothetical protein
MKSQAFDVKKLPVAHQRYFPVVMVNVVLLIFRVEASVRVIAWNDISANSIHMRKIHLYHIIVGKF